jgi:hypothetical protein
MRACSPAGAALLPAPMLISLRRLRTEVLSCAADSAGSVGTGAEAHEKSRAEVHPVRHMYCRGKARTTWFAPVSNGI